MHRQRGGSARGKPIDLASRSATRVVTIHAAVDKLNESPINWERVQKFVVLEHDFPSRRRNHPKSEGKAQGDSGAHLRTPRRVLIVIATHWCRNDAARKMPLFAPLAVLARRRFTI